MAAKPQKSTKYSSNGTVKVLVGLSGDRPKMFDFIVPNMKSNMLTSQLSHDRLEETILKALKTAFGQQVHK